MKGKPYGVDLLVPEKFVGARRAASTATLNDLLPTSTRRSSTTSSLVTTSRPHDDGPMRGVAACGSTRRAWLRCSTCARAPAGSVASALGPPRYFIERAPRPASRSRPWRARSNTPSGTADAGAHLIVAEGTEAGGAPASSPPWCSCRGGRRGRSVAVLAAGASRRVADWRRASRSVPTARGLDRCGCTTEGGDAAARQGQFLGARSGDTRAVAIDDRQAGAHAAQCVDRRMERADGPGPLPMPMQPLPIGPAIGPHRPGCQRAGAQELATYFVGQVVGSMNTVRPAAEWCSTCVEEFIDTVRRLFGPTRRRLTSAHRPHDVGIVDRSPTSGRISR